jgi:hypothetical protein
MMIISGTMTILFTVIMLFTFLTGGIIISKENK